MDLATRGLASAVEVEFGLVWQVGDDWMSKPKDYWPISREFRRNIPEGARHLQVFTARNALTHNTLTRNALTCNELTSRGKEVNSLRLTRPDTA